MGMFVVYSLMTRQEVNDMAAEATKGIEKWFEDNPKRKVCNAELFYNKQYKIHRGKVAKEIRAIADGLKVKEEKDGTHGTQG